MFDYHKQCVKSGCQSTVEMFDDDDYDKVDDIDEIIKNLEVNPQKNNFMKDDNKDKKNDKKDKKQLEKKDEIKDKKPEKKADKKQDKTD